MKRCFVISIFIAVFAGLSLPAENLLPNGNLTKGSSGFKCSVNVPGNFPWRDDLGVMEIQSDETGSFMNVDFSKAPGMKMGVVEISLPKLKEKTEYVFKFKARSVPGSAVIVLMPEPDATGKMNNGVPAGSSSWNPTRPGWTAVETVFVYTPGINNDGIKLFFDGTKAAHSFSFRDFQLIELAK